MKHKNLYGEQGAKVSLSTRNGRYFIKGHGVPRIHRTSLGAVYGIERHVTDVMEIVAANQHAAEYQAFVLLKSIEKTSPPQIPEPLPTWEDRLCDEIIEMATTGKPVPKTFDLDQLLNRPQKSGLAAGIDILLGN